MTRASVLLVVLASACGATRSAYVASLEVRGRELLVEKCTVERTGDELRRGSCFIERHVIPVPIEPSSLGGTP